MIETKLTVDHKVTVPLRVTDFDHFKRIKPSAVLQLFQEAATQQAELMDIGHDAMERRGVFWVVVRTYYEMLAHPQLYSSVTVRTWPHHPSRFSFLRDYTITSLEGTELVRGTSEWVLMSYETRSFVELSSAYEAPDYILDERNFERKPRKIPDFETGNGQPFIIVPSYSMVDMNGHVNNCMYADYPFDALRPDAPLDISSFQIDYRHEVLEGAPLYIHNQPGNGMLLTKGTDGEGTVMFASRATLLG